MNEPTPQGTLDAPASNQEQRSPSFGHSWAGRAYAHLFKTSVGRYQLAFAVLVVGALVIRLWDLSGRIMHYDEAIHLYYSWRLANLEGFVHSPWMHGPFQIELVALFLRLFGDTDVAARLAYVVFGTVLVGLPYLLRDALGRSGALIAGFMLAVSPSFLYFSRFGRNDIIMAVLAVALFTLLWRYANNPKNKHLYLASALLALAFASKETSYIISVIFGMLALLMAIPFSSIISRLPLRRESAGSADLEATAKVTDEVKPGEAAVTLPHVFMVRRLFRTLDLGRLKGPAGFLVLLVTLTLPQWSAGVDLARVIAASAVGGIFGAEAASALAGGFGLTLAATEDVGQGIVGAPAWEAPFVQLPLDMLPVWLPGMFLFLIIAVCIVVGWRLAQSWRQGVAAVLIPLLASYAPALWLVKPIGAFVDSLLAVILGAACLSAFVYFRLPWRSSLLLLFAPAVSSVTFCLLFLPVLKVDALLINVLPEGIQLASSGNAIPLNFLVAGGILLAMGTLSLLIGLWWRGGIWLVCALIFYGIWITLFTTFFTNPAGIFSGVWQGMGYWIAQQDVARGNQPWYYYFVGMSIYEFLPFIFGLLGAVVFFRRGDRFGMALAFWACMNFLAYTIASEKMPWLLVNITVPFILLSGKLLGEIAETSNWRVAFSGNRLTSSIFLTVLPILLLAGASYGFLSATSDEPRDFFVGVVVLAGTTGAALAVAFMVRRSVAVNGSGLVSLGLAAALSALTAWTGLQAAYTYDDSRREILVYAQGSADLRTTFHELNADYLASGDSSLLPNPVQVDYDVWYPFQWYVRHHEGEGTLRFSCFKAQEGEGGCSAIDSSTEATAMLVASHNRGSRPGAFVGYNQSGPRRNLLWFPETYRRPGENRQSEHFLQEAEQDLEFFGEAVVSKEKWNQALKYFFFREMESDWFNSEYYTYHRLEQADTDGTN